MNGSNKRKYRGEDVLTGCLHCLGANQYMNSRGTAGTEILKMSCLPVRYPLLPNNSHHFPVDLELCLCCEGEKKEWHIPVSLTEYLDPEINEMEGKITSYHQFQKSFPFLLKHGFTIQFVP